MAGSLRTFCTSSSVQIFRYFARYFAVNRQVFWGDPTRELNAMTCVRCCALKLVVVPLVVLLSLDLSPLNPFLPRQDYM